MVVNKRRLMIRGLVSEMYALISSLPRNFGAAASGSGAGSVSRRRAPSDIDSAATQTNAIQSASAASRCTICIHIGAIMTIFSSPKSI